MSDDQATTSGASFDLRTFGSVALVRSDGTTVLGTHGNHRRRLALLAVLAAAGERGRSRDQLFLLFWPDATQARAQHSLDQLLYALRNSIGETMFEGTNPLHLNPAVVTSDVGRFGAALARDDLATAVGEYRGMFLDGFYPNDAPEFERWAASERSSLAETYAGALSTLARRATAAGDRDAAVRWWAALTEVDPLSTRNAVGRIRALAAAGDRAAALLQAKRYEALVAQELGLEVDPDVASVMQEVRDAGRDASTVSPVPGTANGVPTSAAYGMPNTAPVSPRPTTISIRPGRERPSWLFPAWIAAVALSIAVLALATRSRPSVNSGQRVGGTSFAAERDSATTGGGSTRDIVAHELYVRGSDPSLTRSDSGARAGLEDFRQAVALDTNYAAAYAGMALMFMRTSAPGSGSAQRRRQQWMLAREAALRAVRLDDSLAEAHAALGFVKLDAYDLAGAMREMTRAAALEPGNARFHEWLVQLDVISGLQADALTEGRRAVALDPLSPTANAELARAYLAADRCDDALAQLDRLQYLRPPLLRAASIAAQCYGKKQIWPKAIGESHRALSGQPRGNGLLGYLLARAGRLTETRLLLDTLRTEERAGRGDAYAIAAIYAGLGDKDSAITWLDRSVEDHSLNFEYMNTILDALAPDGRLDALRRRIGIHTHAPGL